MAATYMSLSAAWMSTLQSALMPLRLRMSICRYQSRGQRVRHEGGLPLFSAAARQYGELCCRRCGGDLARQPAPSHPPQPPPPPLTSSLISSISFQRMRCSPKMHGMPGCVMMYCKHGRGARGDVLPQGMPQGREARDDVLPQGMPQGSGGTAACPNDRAAQAGPGTAAHAEIQAGKEQSTRDSPHTPA